MHNAGKVTQASRYRQSLILYARKYGVTKAAIRYRTNRQYIYRWMKRYDGTLHSLADRSRRPRSHPKQHRPDEMKLIKNMRRRNPNAGLVVFWVKLREGGMHAALPGCTVSCGKVGRWRKNCPIRSTFPSPTSRCNTRVSASRSTSY